jgi:hypothetical protein
VRRALALLAAIALLAAPAATASPRNSSRLDGRSSSAGGVSPPRDCCASRLSISTPSKPGNS